MGKCNYKFSTGKCILSNPWSRAGATHHNVAIVCQQCSHHTARSCCHPSTKPRRSSSVMSWADMSDVDFGSDGEAASAAAAARVPEASTPFAPAAAGRSSDKLAVFFVDANTDWARLPWYSVVCSVTPLTFIPPEFDGRAWCTTRPAAPLPDGTVNAPVVTSRAAAAAASLATCFWPVRHDPSDRVDHAPGVFIAKVDFVEPMARRADCTVAVVVATAAASARDASTTSRLLSEHKVDILFVADVGHMPAEFEQVQEMLEPYLRPRWRHAGHVGNCHVWLNASEASEADVKVKLFRRTAVSVWFGDRNTRSDVSKAARNKRRHERAVAHQPRRRST